MSGSFPSSGEAVKNAGAGVKGVDAKVAVEGSVGVTCGVAGAPVVDGAGVAYAARKDSIVRGRVSEPEEDDDESLIPDPSARELAPEMGSNLKQSGAMDAPSKNCQKASSSSGKAMAAGETWSYEAIGGLIISEFCVGSDGGLRCGSGSKGR